MTYRLALNIKSSILSHVHTLDIPDIAGASQQAVLEVPGWT